MLPEVREGFIPFTNPLEGSVPFFYTDSVGLVTTARGNLEDAGSRRMKPSDPIGAVTPGGTSLPWKHKDGTLATHDEIVSEWWKMKHAWPAISSVNCGKIAMLFLDQEDVDALTLCELDRMWGRVLFYFPDAEQWPAPAQLGVLSMCWAMGGDFEPGYPHFDAAAKAQDWAACANQCAMSKPPVPVERNRRNKVLFERAAVGDSELTF